MNRQALRAALVIVCVMWAVAASAQQQWTPEQQELWKLEEQQWQMSKDKDASWIDKMVHPNLAMWETGEPAPRNRASLVRWNKYTTGNATVLEQEIFPLAVTVTGNVAVVQYYYQVARENYKKERETVQGHYTDVLVREGGRWLFIAWSGGDDPKK